MAEARQIAQAGIDMVIAQGWEAGGHRGMFDPDGADDRMDTLTLTGAICTAVDRPVIAAGGIMDGTGIRAALGRGAVAAQLGTAFIPCPESAADAAYRAALGGGLNTEMTRVVSGRPARSLSNDLVQWGADTAAGDIPAYPVAYDAGKALNTAAKGAGETGYGAQWAGMGHAACRAMPAAELMAELTREMG